MLLKYCDKLLFNMIKLSRSVICKILTKPAVRGLQQSYSNIPKYSWNLPQTPELDLDYICNPDNRQEIENNASIRKGVGNINLVHELKAKLDDLKPGSEDYSKAQQVFLKEALKIPNRTHQDVKSLMEPKAISTIGEKVCCTC